MQPRPLTKSPLLLLLLVMWEAEGLLRLPLAEPLGQTTEMDDAVDLAEDPPTLLAALLWLAGELGSDEASCPRKLQ